MARPADTLLVVVVVIDLDDFKALNDNHGHSAGDRALVQVAQALQANTCDTAVIARSGGEEFIVADTSSASDPGPLARRICNAIADLPAPVTASVGTACAPLDGVHERGYEPLIDHLVSAADAACIALNAVVGTDFTITTWAINVSVLWARLPVLRPARVLVGEVWGLGPSQ